ncbi:hypothetical protein ACFL35_09755 [Candidatus Riflebacteria bacterium]
MKMKCSGILFLSLFLLCFSLCSAELQKTQKDTKGKISKRTLPIITTIQTRGIKITVFAGKKECLYTLSDKKGKKLIVKSTFAQIKAINPTIFKFFEKAIANKKPDGFLFIDASVATDRVHRWYIKKGK